MQLIIIINMKELKQLIDLKTIITLSLIFSTIVFVGMGILDSEIIKTLTLTVIAYYFGKAQGKAETDVITDNNKGNIG